MATWRFEDLLFFTGAVYGLAWLFTKSKLLRRPREAVGSVPFLGGLTRCLVCTAGWISLGVILLLPRSALLSERLAVRPVDVLLLLGWTLFSTWALGRVLGDAE